MSISGSLEDVAVADVLQFIYLGKRTGTLALERAGESARFAFHEGTLVGAQAPGAPRLGDLLVEGGHVTQDELDEPDRNGLLLNPTKADDDLFDESVAEIFHRQAELRRQEQTSVRD